MPYKVFVAGEEALAADANAYLMSQTVPRFTNAAQRTSQLTAPVLNQLSMLDTRPGVSQYWNGSAWTDSVPFIQARQELVTTDAAGKATITFPVAFSAAPYAILAQIPFGMGFVIQASATNTSVPLTFNNQAGGLYSSVQLFVVWIAIGVR